MAVSKKRKKNSHLKNLTTINPKERADNFLYLTDFMMSVADSVTEYSLITYERLAHVKPEHKDNEDLVPLVVDNYDYILFRDENGGLLEHSNGSDLVDKLANAMVKGTQKYVTNLTVHYFNRDNVHDQGNGMLFNIPYRAVQWTLEGNEFVPDKTGGYTTGDILIEPGEPFDRAKSLVSASATSIFSQGTPVQMKRI